MSFATVLEEQAGLHPDEPALICRAERVRWRSFDERLNRVANALTGLGVKREDKVAILSRMCPAAIEVFLGAIRAGACAVPLPGTADLRTLERLLVDSDAKVLALSASAYEPFLPIANRLPQLLAGGRIALDVSAPGWARYEELLALASPSSSVARPRPGDAFNILYSSGTTGVPKGIVHSHRMRAFQAARMARFDLGPRSVTLLSTPLWSNATLAALLPALARGGTVVLMPEFDAAGFLSISQSHGVTHAMLVPLQYRRILAAPDFDRYDLSAYSVKWSTGEALPGPLKRQIVARWPGRLIEIYGVSEGGCTTLLDVGARPDKIDSVGRPADGVEVRILSEHGRVLAQGETGEIAGRAVSMMTGYHKRMDLTEKIVWRDERGRVFYRTGDLGRLDEDGFLYLKGRLKDIIISGGVNIYADDLEAVISRHPAVSQTAVIAVPSERWGETPLALVVPEEGRTLIPDEILHWANRRLGKTQQLSGVEVRASLPRNSMGKLLKQELRDAYRR